MKKAIVVVFALVFVVILACFFNSSTDEPLKNKAEKAPATVSQQKPELPVASGITGTTAIIRQSGTITSPTPAATSGQQLGQNPASPVIEIISTETVTGKDVFRDNFVKRRRPIAINPGLLEKDNKLEPGSRISLSFFPDAKYNITLRQVFRNPQGDISANGILDGEEYGTFSLSTANGVVLARLSDPATRKLFLIRCNGHEKTHYALEMDPEKMPVSKQNDVM